MFAQHFAKKAQVIKCFLWGDQIRENLIKWDQTARGFGPWGTKSAVTPVLSAYKPSAKVPSLDLLSSNVFCFKAKVSKFSEFLHVSALDGALFIALKSRNV